MKKLLLYCIVIIMAFIVSCSNKHIKNPAPELLYKSKTIIQINNTNNSLTLPGKESDSREKLLTTDSIYNILYSEEFTDRIVKTYSLDKAEFTKRLDVKTTDKEKKIIEISYSDEDKSNSAVIVNNITRELIKYNIEAEERCEETILKDLAIMEANLSNTIFNLKSQLIEYELEHGSDLTDSTYTEIKKQLNIKENEYNNIIEKEAEFRITASGYTSEINVLETAEVPD